MQRRKILIVFGTRPEAIKMAPLYLAFQKNSEKFHTEVCVTAQHREMLDQVLALFNIRPVFDLNIMRSGQDLYDITSRVLLGMREVLKKSNPDLVLVHGDTTTSTATALSSFYQQIPVAHIEAGLRTKNIYSPWPEEMNRQLTGRLASIHFSPTAYSKQNLINEGVDEKKIFVTGNTVIDALLWVIKKAQDAPSLKKQILDAVCKENLTSDLYHQWLNKERKLVLITGHRRENFGNGFLNICKAIKKLSGTFPNVDFVYPMHLNPNVRKAVEEVFGNRNDPKDKNEKLLSNVFFLEPLDYLPFVNLMNAAYLILTDSGGIQEEAPGLGKPVLVMRDTTERPEALESGTVKLVGTDEERIIKEVSLLLNNVDSYTRMSTASNPYGDGKASERIVKEIENYFL